MFSVECAGVERANMRQSSWSGEGAPQLTTIACSPELDLEGEAPGMGLRA